jgi:type I restriction enzyme, S subunit
VSLNLDRSTWKRVKLGDVVLRSRAQVDPFKGDVDRYVAGGHIDTDSVIISRSGEVTDGQMGSTFRYVFRPGQVLFVSARPYLRKSGVPDFAGVVADKTYVLEATPNNGLLKDMLPFLLTSDRFVEYANQEATGSMNPRLLWGPMQRYEFDLPPLDEQKRLADLLWVVERQQHSISEEMQAIESVRRSHLEDRMGVVSSSAGTVTLDSLIEKERPITYGILMPGTRHDGGVPVIKVRDFPDGRIHEDNLLLVDPKLAYDYRRSTLRAGDLLISIRGTIGRLAEVPRSLDGANITQDTARLSIASAHNRRYIRLVLESEFAHRQIRAQTTGLAVKGLNIGALRKLQIPIPADRALEERLVHESAQVSCALAAAEDEMKAVNAVRSALSVEIFGGLT